MPRQPLSDMPILCALVTNNGTSKLSNECTDLPLIKNLLAIPVHPKLHYQIIIGKCFTVPPGPST